MGSQDLNEGSGSCHDNDKKGVAGKLKGLFGSLRKPERVATLDDDRFIRDVPEEPIAKEEPTPFRRRINLDDFDHIGGNSRVPVIECEVPVDTPFEASVGTHTEDVEDVVEVYGSMTEADAVEDIAASSEPVVEESVSFIDYYDFLPSTGPTVKRDPGVRNIDTTVSRITPRSSEAIFDPDEPVTGLSIAIDEFIAQAEGSSVEPEMVIEIEAPTNEISIEAVEEIIEVETITKEEEHVPETYVPNFVLVDETVKASSTLAEDETIETVSIDEEVIEAVAETEEITLESALPEDIMRAMDEEDELALELDIDVYDDSDEYVTIEVDTVTEQRNGVSFGFHCSPSAAESSGVSFSWGVPERTEAKEDIRAERPIIYL